MLGDSWLVNQNIPIREGMEIGALFSNETSVRTLLWQEGERTVLSQLRSLSYGSCNLLSSSNSILINNIPFIIHQQSTLLYQLVRAVLVMHPKIIDQVTAVELCQEHLELESGFESFHDNVPTKIRKKIPCVLLAQKETPQQCVVGAEGNTSAVRCWRRRKHLSPVQQRLLRHSTDAASLQKRWNCLLSIVLILLLDHSCRTSFEVQGISEDVRIQLTNLSMEGPKIHSFNLRRDSTESLTQEDLKDGKVMMRFGGGCLDNPFEELKELRQTSLGRKTLLNLNFICCRVDAGAAISGVFYGRLASQYLFSCSSHQTMQPVSSYAAST